MRHLLVLALRVAGALALASAPAAALARGPERESPRALLAALEQARDGGLDEAETEALCARWERSLAECVDPAERLSLVQCAQRLCREGRGAQLAHVREQALATLVRSAEGSPRARRLLLEAFVPSRVGRGGEEERRVLLAYDAELDRLRESAPGEAARAALAYARLHPLLELSRSWERPWLDAAERQRIARELRALAAAHGELPHPLGGSYRALIERDLRELESAAFGASIEAVRGVDLEGRAIGPEQTRGKVVVLVFWSSWCLPCLEAVGEERALVESLAAEPFVLLGACGDEDAATARATAQRTGMSWSSLLDGMPGKGDGGALARALGVRAWPSAFVYDREGRLRRKLVATLFRPTWTTADLRAAVLELLEEGR